MTKKVFCHLEKVHLFKMSKFNDYVLDMDAPMTRGYFIFSEELLNFRHIRGASLQCQFKTDEIVQVMGAPMSMEKLTISEIK